LEFGGEEDGGDANVIGGVFEGFAEFVDCGGAECVEDGGAVEGDAGAAVGCAYFVGYVGKVWNGIVVVGGGVVFVVMDGWMSGYEVESIAEFGGG